MHSAWTRTLLPLMVASLIPFACMVKGKDAPLPDGPDTSGEGGTNFNDGGQGGNNHTPPDPDDPGGEPECPYTGAPPIDVNTLPSCPSCDIGGAHCLPNPLVPADFQDQLAACDAESLCVPDHFIETTGEFIPATCESVAGAEGRCLSPCLPQVAEQADSLPQSTCGATDVCVPCYDPQTGLDTGACTLSCDPGPTEPPVLLPECCTEDGVSYGTCVPRAAAGDQADRLGEDSCPPGGDLVCAPNEFVEDINHVAPVCEDFFRGIVFGDEFKEGRCLSNCIPEVADAPLTGAGDCDGENVKCVPCISPLDGQSTGACDL